MTIWTEMTDMFRARTTLQLAAAELAEAERSLLIAETGLEYAGSQVSYNKARITRLRRYLADQTKDAAV